MPNKNNYHVFSVYMNQAFCFTQIVSVNIHPGSYEINPIIILMLLIKN